MELPDQIGKYRILALLGSGAMGEVFKALDPGIGRLVALKRVHAALLEGEAGREIAIRFQREAQAAGRLIHSHIVSIFEYGEEAGVPYIAMELVEGTDLKALLQARQPLPVDAGVAMLGQILDALGFAHANGVVHRDIKPANIVRLASGLVKVMDFGIARLDASNLTQTGVMLGSPNYMSPEQVRGEKVDGRSDLFSTGVLAFELLTGEKPFHAHGLAAVMHRILSDPAPAASGYNPLLSPAFDAVLNKALAKGREERYQTATEFWEALAGAWRAGEAGPLVARPLTDVTATLELPVSAVVEPGVTVSRAWAGAPRPLGGEGTTLAMTTGLGGGTQLSQSSTITRLGATAWQAEVARGPVYLPLPVEEIPSGPVGVSLYLTFKGNFVLYLAKGLTLDDSVRSQWAVSGIERVFVREEEFGDFLLWLYRGAGGPLLSGANAMMHYLQEHFYQVEAPLFTQGSQPPFPLFLYHQNRLLPVVAPDIPGVAPRVEGKLLAASHHVFIQLVDLRAYYDYISQQLGREAKLIPLNRKGAALARERVRIVAHELFKSPKVGEALVAAKRAVVETLDLIVNNQDTYYAMLAVSSLDSNTYVHSANVAVLSVGLGYAMGLSRGQLLHLGLGGLLHDIGKREIDGELLMKKNALTAREYETLKEHVLLGEAFCRAQFGIPEAVIRIVAQHHERLDGSGYPRGLQGEELDLMSQVVAIMEIYDALTSVQPFRQAMTPFKALRRLRKFELSINQELVSIFIHQLGMQQLKGEGDG